MSGLCRAIKSSPQNFETIASGHLLHESARPRTSEGSGATLRGVRSAGRLGAEPRPSRTGKVMHADAIRYRSQ
jgi:hypothetical protein